MISQRTLLLFGIFIGLIIFAFGAYCNGLHPSSVIQFTSFLAVGGGLLCLSLISFKWSDLKKLLSIEHMSSGEIDQSIFTIRRIRNYAFLCAAIVTIMSFIHVLANLKMPDRIGPGVAVEIVSLFYGFCFAVFIAMSLEWSLLKNEDSIRDDEKSGFSVIRFVLLGFAAMACFILVFHIEGGRIWFYAQAGSWLMAISGPVVLFVSRPKLFLSVFKQKSEAASNLIAKSFLASGILGLIVNEIHVFRNLDKPETLSVGVATTFIPMLYSLIGFSLFYALSRDSSREKGDSDTSLWLAYGFTVIALYAQAALVAVAINLIK